MPAPAALNVRKGDHPAVAHLRGILHLIDSVPGQPTAALLSQIKDGAINAMDVLRMPDPDAQRMATAVLVLAQSTRIQTRKVFGRSVDKVMVTDPVGYDWAMGRIHQLMAMAA